METQRLKAPSPPSPGKSDLASFPAFMKYQERINGFRFPEAELREQRELSASLHDSGRSGLVTSVVMLDRARRTDYDPQAAVGCTGRDATNLPAI